MNPQLQSIRVAIGGLDSPNPDRPKQQAAPQPPRRETQTPLIDIHEEPDGLILEADLPGVTDDSVSVQLEDNVLSLQARVGPGVSDGARLIHEEYRVVEYQRSFILSDEVDRARISAELKNGVLRIRLPKAERAQARRIEIKSQS
jgi:HSP20 family molecular chaperone IbpA